MGSGSVSRSVQNIITDDHNDDDLNDDVDGDNDDHDGNDDDHDDDDTPILTITINMQAL